MPSSPPRHRNRESHRGRRADADDSGSDSEENMTEYDRDWMFSLSRASSSNHDSKQEGNAATGAKSSRTASRSQQERSDNSRAARRSLTPPSRDKGANHVVSPPSTRNQKPSTSPLRRFSPPPMFGFSEEEEENDNDHSSSMRVVDDAQHGGGANGDSNTENGPVTAYSMERQRRSTNSTVSSEKKAISRPSKPQKQRGALPASERDRDGSVSPPRHNKRRESPSRSNGRKPPPAAPPSSSSNNPSLSRTNSRNHEKVAAPRFAVRVEHGDSNNKSQPRRRSVSPRGPKSSSSQAPRFGSSRFTVVAPSRSDRTVESRNSRSRERNAPPSRDGRSNKRKRPSSPVPSSRFEKRHAPSYRYTSEDRAQLRDIQKYLNPKRFRIPEDKSARFFIIRGPFEQDFFSSIRYGYWASTPRGNKLLAREMDSGAKDVYLIFHLNGAQHFSGVARVETRYKIMIDKKLGLWKTPNWKGVIPIEWIFVKDIPVHLFGRLKNQYNERPVGNQRDMTELDSYAGRNIMDAFIQERASSSILSQWAELSETVPPSSEIGLVDYSAVQL